MNNDLENALKSIVEALGQAQAYNLANNFILMEIVRDLSRTTPHPHKYLADMFERISARADQDEIENESHPVNVEFRDAISRFFANAGKSLREEEEGSS